MNTGYSGYLTNKQTVVESTNIFCLVFVIQIFGFHVWTTEVCSETRCPCYQSLSCSVDVLSIPAMQLALFCWLVLVCEYFLCNPDAGLVEQENGHLLSLKRMPSIVTTPVGWCSITFKTRWCAFFIDSSFSKRKILSPWRYSRKALRLKHVV